MRHTTLCHLRRVFKQLQRETQHLLSPNTSVPRSCPVTPEHTSKVDRTAPDRQPDEVSVAALIAAVTHGKFAPPPEERLEGRRAKKTHSNILSFPLQRTALSNLASCLTCVNFEMLLQSVWASAICSPCQWFSNSLLKQGRKNRRRRGSNVYIGSDGGLQPLFGSYPLHHVCFTPSPPSPCTEASSQLAWARPAVGFYSLLRDAVGKSKTAVLIYPGEKVTQPQGHLRPLSLF